MSGSGKRTVVADLTVRKGADEKVPLPHIGGNVRSTSSGLRVNREIRFSFQVGRVPAPRVQHFISKSVPLRVPAFRISVQSVWRLFPHERGMLSCRRLRRIEQRGATAPHNVGRFSSALMARYHLEVTVHVVQPQNHHERLCQMGTVFGGAVARRLIQIEIQGKQRCDEIVPERPRAVPPFSRQRILVQEVQKRLVRVQARGDEVTGAQPLAGRGFHPCDPLAIQKKPPGFRLKAQFAAALGDRGRKRPRKND